MTTRRILFPNKLSYNQSVETLEKIVDLFSSKEIVGKTAHAFINAPAKPSSKWSLLNRIYMLLSGTEDARGYRQWQEVNRNVKKGAKAFYILAPQMKKGRVEIKENDIPTGEYRNEYYLIGFKNIPVFRFEDTEGEDLPVYEPLTIPPLMDVATSWGVNINYDIESGAYGSFNPNKDKITLGSEDMSVFFHELAHKAQDKLKRLKPGQDSRQEAEAELSSAFL